MAIFNIGRRRKEAIEAAARAKIDRAMARYVQTCPLTRNPVVESIVHGIAKTVSTLGLDLYQRTKSGDYKSFTHPSAILMDNPNQEDSATQFLYRMTEQYLATGNVYILMQDSYTLRLLPSRSIHVWRDSEPPYQKIYTYNGGGTYTDAEILHIYNPQYYDEFRGIGHSPIEFNSETIDILSKLLLYIGTYFDNSPGARLYINMPPDELKELKDENVKKELQRMIEENFVNKLAAGKPVFLRTGYEAKKIDLTSNAESDLDSLLKTVIQQVANLFGYPSYMLDGSYGNNLKDQQIHYLQEAILPITEVFSEKFKRLLPLKDRPYMYWKFNYDTLLMVDTETKHKILREDVRGTLLTPNEARREIGRDVYLGGADTLVADALWVLRNNAPVFEEYRDRYIEGAERLPSDAPDDSSATN